MINEHNNNVAAAVEKIVPMMIEIMILHHVEPRHPNLVIHSLI
jgi:hypothetical protein